MIIFVKVIAKSSKSEVEGFVENVLKVKVRAPKDKGKANLELIGLLADYYKIPKSNIEIISGKTSPLKKIRITPISTSAL